MGRGGYLACDTEKGKWRRSGLYPETSYPFGNAPFAYRVPQQQMLVPKPGVRDTYELEDYCIHIHKGAKICPAGTARDRVADIRNVRKEMHCEVNTLEPGACQG